MYNIYLFKIVFCILFYMAQPFILFGELFKDCNINVPNILDVSNSMKRKQCTSKQHKASKRILKLGCWSQSITTKPAPKGLNIAFHISQSININYFPQNIMEVSFIVINQTSGLSSMFPEMHMRVPAVILVQHFKYLLSGTYFVFLGLFSYTCFLSKFNNRSEGCYVWRSSWPKSL